VTIHHNIQNLAHPEHPDGYTVHSLPRCQRLVSVKGSDACEVSRLEAPPAHISKRKWGPAWVAWPCSDDVYILYIYIYIYIYIQCIYIYIYSMYTVYIMYVDDVYTYYHIIYVYYRCPFMCIQYITCMRIQKLKQLQRWNHNAGNGWWMAAKALNDRHSGKKNDRNQQVPESTGLIYTQIWVLAQILSTQTLKCLPQVNKRYNSTVQSQQQCISRQHSSIACPTSHHGAADRSHATRARHRNSFGSHLPRSFHHAHVGPVTLG